MKAIKINSLWCPSCLIMKPIFEELAQELAITITDLDFDLDDEEVAKYKIGRILPVLIFLTDEGQELVRFIGEKKKSDIINKLNEVRIKWKKYLS